MAAALLVLALGCGKKAEPAPKMESPPVVAAAPAPPPPKPPRDVREFIPSNLRFVLGARPSMLKDASASVIRRDLAPLIRMLESIGLKQADIAEFWAGSALDGKELAVCVQAAAPINQETVRAGLKASPAGNTVGDAKLHALEADTFDNCVAFVDDKVVLIGRRSTVEAALANPAAGAVRHGLSALDGTSHPIWLAGDAKAAASLLDHSSTPGLQPLVQGARGLPGVAAAMSFGNDFTVAIALACKSADQAAAIKGPLEAAFASEEKALAELENAMRKAADAKAAEAKAAGGSTDPAPSQTGRIRLSPLKGRTVALSEEKLRIKLQLEPGSVSVGDDVARAIGLRVTGNGLFQGSLVSFAGGYARLAEKNGLSKGINLPKNVSHRIFGYSWMCELLPHLGHEDLHAQLDFEKSWSKDDNGMRAAYRQIPEFLNPANPNTRWQGLPWDGMALTHFVGMSGVEDAPNVLAAELPRSDPRAGVFGYDEVIKPSQITDGVGSTILMIGSEKIAGAWIQGGGATVRGARAPYFDPVTGFASQSLPKPGAFVLMADGSVRTLSARIDPKVFQALCTAHGGESVDLTSNAPPVAP